MSHKFTECTQLCAHKHVQNQQSTKTSTRTHTNSYPQTLTHSQSDLDAIAQTLTYSQKNWNSQIKPYLWLLHIRSHSRPSSPSRRTSSRLQFRHSQLYYSLTAVPTTHGGSFPRHYSTHAQMKTLIQTRKPEMKIQTKPLTTANYTIVKEKTNNCESKNKAKTITKTKTFGCSTLVPTTAQLPFYRAAFFYYLGGYLLHLFEGISFTILHVDIRGINSLIFLLL